MGRFTKKSMGEFQGAPLTPGFTYCAIWNWMLIVWLSLPFSTD